MEEETYKNLVEHSPDAIIITRSAEILYMNDTGVELLGAACKKDVVGKKMSDFLTSEGFESFKKYIKDIDRGAVNDFTSQKLHRFDASPIEVEVKGIQTTYNGEPANLFIMRDVEKRKKAERFLLQSEKLLVAGQLAAGIAHEVRNPLTAIKGFLQLAEEGFRDNQSYFEIIHSEINRIEAILGELLALAKPKDMDFQVQSVKQLIDEVTTLLDTEALMNNIEIKTFFNTDLAKITCDKDQLKQVFINFIKNSIEAMPAGGTVSIYAEQTSKNGILLRFCDTGCGIPKELLKRIEEPFFTTKENGTGLGLMICKQIIENHNGRIVYDSRNGGTTIELHLPASHIQKSILPSPQISEQQPYKIALN